VVGEVEDDECAEGVLVEGLVEGAEAFLTGCVPDLQHHFPPVDRHMLLGELQSDGGVAAHGELVLYVAADDVGLPHAALSCLDPRVPTSTIFMYFFPQSYSKSCSAIQGRKVYQNERING
jgi:hypothetical protein